MIISCKAVLFDADGQVLLGSNPRGEWELLGGQPDPGDRDPQATIRRELAEEAGLEVSVGDLVDIWYYEITGAGRVAVASYLAQADPAADPRLSEEHGDVRFFPLSEARSLHMPDGYKHTIVAAARMAGHTG